MTPTMGRLACVLGLLALTTATNTATNTAEHPIVGVITLLEELEVESRKEGEAEAATFQKFEYWCKRSTKMLTRSMKKAKKSVGELTDEITGLQTEIATLGEDLKKIDAELEVLDQQEQKAKAMRKEEHELYSQEVENLDGSITATDEAVHTLEDSEAAVAEFFQVSQRKGDPADLLKLDPGKNNPFKPKAKVYGSHGGGVIETFKALEDGWGIDKLSEEEQETNAINAFNLAKQAREKAQSTAKASKAEKTSLLGEKESALATATQSKAENEKSLESDALTLEDTDQECKAKTGEYQERTKVREGELAAMAVAKKILAKVAGVQTEVPAASLLMDSSRVDQDTADLASVLGDGVSFLQADGPKKQAVNLLRKVAHLTHSKKLQKLAAVISEYAGPFDKIKAMIQKMIFQLQGEQKDEDEHKNWCDQEMEMSTESQETKSAKVADLTKESETMTADMGVLSMDVKNNEAKVAALTETMASDTDLRNQNHEELMSAVKDAQDAQKALKDAIAVLSDFYKSTGKMESLVQVHSRDLPDKPETWDSSYSGSSGSDKIMSILEKTMSKFSKMEADATAQDESDQKAYETDQAAMKVELAGLETDSQMKSSRKDSISEKHQGVSGKLKATQGELDAVEQYLKDLQPACGDGDSSYSDRKKARSDEIDALRKAQTILEEAFRAKAFLAK